MNNKYQRNIKLRCITCGDDSSFEFNEDKSYIKCIRCNREYFGGYDELVELNKTFISSSIDELKEQAEADITKKLKSIFDKH
jgi:hypothetical protein